MREIDQLRKKVADLDDLVEDLKLKIEFYRGTEYVRLPGLTKVQQAIVMILFARRVPISDEDMCEILTETTEFAGQKNGLSVQMVDIRARLGKQSVEKIRGDGFILSEAGREWVQQAIEKHSLDPRNPKAFEQWLTRTKIFLREPTEEDAFSQREQGAIAAMCDKYTAEGASRKWPTIFGRKRTAYALMDEATRLGVLFRPAQKGRSSMVDAEIEAAIRVYISDQQMSEKEAVHELNDRFQIDIDEKRLNAEIKRIGISRPRRGWTWTPYWIERARRLSVAGETQIDAFRIIKSESGKNIDRTSWQRMLYRENIRFTKIWGASLKGEQLNLALALAPDHSGTTVTNLVNARFSTSYALKTVMEAVWRAGGSFATDDDKKNSRARLLRVSDPVENVE